MVANGMENALVCFISGIIWSAFIPIIIMVAPEEYRVIPIIITTTINIVLIYSEITSLLSSTILSFIGYGIIVYSISLVDIKMALEIFTPYILTIAMELYKLRSN